MIEREAALLALGAVLAAGPVFGDDDRKYKGTTYSHGSAVCNLKVSIDVKLPERIC
jgi:hypothetical protein